MGKVLDNLRTKGMKFNENGGLTNCHLLHDIGQALFTPLAEVCSRNETESLSYIHRLTQHEFKGGAWLTIEIFRTPISGNSPQ